MKAIIIYYTFGGSTKKEAQKLAIELDAPVYRIEEMHSRSLFGAFVGGSAAIHRKASAIKPVHIDLNEYDRIIIGCPIWAGYPAPAFNAIVELLPPNKDVELFFCSGGGDIQKSEQGTKELIEKKGCRVISLRNIRTEAPPSKFKG